MAEKGKFHISNGRVMPCTAKGPCPLGGEHFDKKAQAEKHIENENKGLYGMFPELKGAKTTEDTKMKKYVFEDGSEIRGVLLDEGYRGKVILDENAKKHNLRDLPKIERETFVKGVDPQLREALESVKESHDKKLSEYAEIERLEQELRRRKIQLSNNVDTQENNFKQVYQDVKGLYSGDNFKREVSTQVDEYLKNRFPRVEHGISSEGPETFIAQNFASIRVPVDMIRHPGDGDWDLYREYDGTLHSYGSDMTATVNKHARRFRFDIDEMKEKVNNLSVAKEGKVSCETSVGDKIATLDLRVVLDYDEDMEYSQANLDSMVAEIQSIFR